MMKFDKITRRICIVIVLCILGNQGFAQTQAELNADLNANTEKDTFQQFYLGPGFGLDYGGFGAKFEYLPIKRLELFAGLGYNLLSVGWNVGAAFKILPDKNISPNLLLMCGYNGVTVIKGASEYNMTSYGLTLGANVDFKMGRKGHKITVGLFYPFRSTKFMNNYDDIKNAPWIRLDSELLPVAFSIGLNFAL